MSSPEMLALLVLVWVRIYLVGAGSVHEVASIKHNHDSGIQLVLGHGKIYDSASYQKAIIFLEELKSASSCHRLAATTLVLACQSIDQKTGIDVALAEVKEEYAAKVAACELNAAYNKDIVPKACKLFLPTTKACSKAGAASEKLCYAYISRLQVTACISKLEDRPQSWTSYSNALQNVHNTCQASRLALDKDIMLDQLKSALETFTSANDQTHQVLEHYQTEAVNNLARFQQVHTDILAATKEAWSKMSDEITEHTWKSYLNMFGDIAKHYANLTDFIASSSSTVITKQKEALFTADLVNDALTNSVATSQDLVVQQADFSKMASTGNAALLSQQESIHTQADFIALAVEMMGNSLSEQAESLKGVVNSTNAIREFVDSSGPLIDLLAPLAPATRLAVTTAKAMHHVDMLIVVCVMVNLFTLGFVMSRLVVALVTGGLLRSLVALHLALCLLYVTNTSQRDMWSFIWFVLTSRVSGGLVLALYHCGIFEYPLYGQIKTRMATLFRFENTGSCPSSPSPPTAPLSRISAEKRVKLASPVGVNLSPRNRLQMRAKRNRATSEEVRGIPVWN